MALAFAHVPTMLAMIILSSLTTAGGMAVVGAEYVLNWLPRGTHDYAKFIKPSELARWAKQANLEPEEVVGMSYNPVTKVYALGRDTSINYLMRAIRHD